MDRMRIALYALVLVSGAAVGQGTPNAFPTKPVSLVTPTASGGSADLESRLYAQKLTATTGQPFLVETRPGAGGRVGMGYVAKAAPDGHTLLMVTSTFTLAPALFRTLPYDPVRDFAPATLMSTRTTMLLAYPSFPATSLKEYLAYAKASPGAINFATTGLGNITHLAGAWLHDATNTRATFVHYKGSAMWQDVMSGRVQVTLASFVSGLPYVKSGKLRVLALTSLERNPLMPDMQTIAEQGIPGFEYPSWLGVAAPGKTPVALVERISAEFAKVAKSSDVAQKLGKEEGSTMVGSTPEEFRRYLASEMSRWPRLVKDIGIELED